MKRFYTIMLLGMAALTSVHAQWNTNATPQCLLSANYVDEQGVAHKGGDYYGCSVKTARTADKKTWVAWKTSGKKEVRGVKRTAVRTYLQLLDKDGVPQFDTPILVNDYATTTWWSRYGLCVAADGSAIVTVADGRAEEATLSDDMDHPYGFQPAIYKIDQEGNFLWGLDGVEYREYMDAGYTNCFVIGSDTYFIFCNVKYGDETADDALYGTFIQRISDDGVPVWDAPKRLSPTSELQYELLPTTNDELLFFDRTNDGSRVQRMNKDLEPVWDEPVIYDEYAYGGNAMNSYRVVSDGMGGACVAFQRFMGEFSHNIRVQHINEDGSLGFGLSGLDAYNAEEYDHNYPSIAVNPATQEILVQFASEMGDGGCVMHQKFSYDGDYLYDERGKTIAQKSKSTSNGYMFGVEGVGSLSGGDWIAIYRDLAAYARESFIIRRYDKDGNQVWTRTIGRNLSASDINLTVEDEAVYLFYREYNDDKEPGIKMFRIATDGSYNVTYPDQPDGIQEVEGRSSASVSHFFTPDGRRHAQPQRGLNIVRKADGSVEKVLR